MNSTSKQCPECLGTGKYTKGFVGGLYVNCQKCQGTGVILVTDPTTAGSEPPPVLSRACSLPALAKVKREVEIRMQSAAELKGIFDKWPAPMSAGLFMAVQETLRAVLGIIAEAEHEEPEGNVRMSDGL
jgi:hypothetical protein